MRRYKQEYIRYLSYAISSNDETIDHLETLFETGSLTEQELYQSLHDKLELVGKKIRSVILQGG
jgi:four helix bundle protein